MRFTVAYHGRITQGRGLYFFKEEPGRPHRPQQVYSGGGTDGNPRWTPDLGGAGRQGHLGSRRHRARAPHRGIQRPPGERSAERARRESVHWAQEKPASTYLISLAAAPFVRIGERGPVPLEYYVYREDSTLARPLFGVTADMIRVYARLTGVPFPWNKYAQVTVADFIGGMENVSATTLVDWLPDARAYRDRPWYRQSLIPHELAHQWFGNLVTAENWANYWLNEGMAEFMPGQYWGATLGRHAEEDYYLDEYQEYLLKDARRRTPLATWNSNNVYPKGALVLWMLQKQLGREPFWAAMNRYLTSHAYGNATSDDLRQAVLEATGQSLPWFWSQWIYQAGLSRIFRSLPLRHGRLRAGPHRAADPAGHRDRGQHRCPLQRAPGVPRADRDPGGDGRGRRGRAGDDRPAGAGGADRGGPKRAHHGELRRRERGGEDARVPPAHRVARRAPPAPPGPLAAELGHRSTGVSRRRSPGRPRAGPRGRGGRLRRHPREGGRGLAALPARSGAAGVGARRGGHLLAGAGSGGGGACRKSEGRGPETWWGGPG